MGKDYTKPKLADILFRVALTLKLTIEASLAIKAVVLPIEDLAEENFFHLVVGQDRLKDNRVNK